MHEPIDAPSWIHLLNRYAQRSKGDSPAQRIKLARLDVRHAGAVVPAQHRQGLALGVPDGPAQGLGQALGGVGAEAGPHALHQAGQPLLVGRRRQAARVLGGAKDHVQVDAVVGAAGGEQARVVPVGHEAVGKGRHAARGPGLRLERHGAGEGLEQEGLHLRGRGDHAVAEHGQAVVAVLVVVVAHEGGDRREGVLRRPVHVLLGRKHNLAVRDRVKGRHGPEHAGAGSRADGAGRGVDGGPVGAAHAGHLVGVGAASHGLDDRVPVPLRHPGGVDGEAKGVARGGDDGVGDGVVAVRVGPVVDGDAARRLARDGDAGGVAAKRGRVVAHPLDGGALVADAQVLRLEAGGAGEAKDAEAVGDGHDDEVLGLGQVLARVHGAVGVADGEAAAVEEDEDGLLGGGLLGRRPGPDVEGEAVLALRGARGAGKVADDAQGLRRQVREGGRGGRDRGAVESIFGRFVGGRRAGDLFGSGEAKLTYGWLRIRDAKVLDHTRRV
ncbi:hypothetical protein ACKVWC_011612 [Pyricularia oryzae]